MAYKEYVVKEGDCISSIAQREGLWWNTIWNDSKNSELQRIRKDPNVLLPGDVVFVPDKKVKKESCSTSQRHRFLRKGVPCIFRMRFLLDGEPRSSESFIAKIDGVWASPDTTTDTGMIEIPIPCDTKNILLRVGNGDTEEEYDIDIGNLDPITDDSGLHERLQNLGYHCGPDEESTESAIKKFQAEHDLPVSGKPDDTTRKALSENYGC